MKKYKLLLSTNIKVCRYMDRSRYKIEGYGDGKGTNYRTNNFID